MHYFKMILICLLLPVCMQAQNIIVRDGSGNIVNNDTLVRVAGLTQKPPYTEIDCYLYPENASGAIKDIGAKKTEITLGTDVEHSICFARVCYASTVFTSPNGSTLTPGAIDSTFSGHYRFLADTHTPSRDLVAYTFYDRNNVLDSAVVYVIYDTYPTTGIQSANGYTKPAIFPNPANGMINFDCTKAGSEPKDLIIINSMGQIVMGQVISNTDKLLCLNTSQWPEGCYHYALYTEDNNMSNGSFVIAH